MLDTKNFELKLQEFVSQSKIVRGKKEAIEAVIHGAYSVVCDYSLQRFARPKCNMGFKNMSFLLSEFNSNEKEYDLLQSSVQALLKIYAENEPFTDVLTEIYGQFLGYDKGQHMTPPDLASMLAMITLDGVEENFKGNHSFTIGDPTGCGTGAMILGSMKHIYEKHGKDGIAYCNFVGVELDRTLAMASVIQVELGSILHNIQFNRFEIYNENALTGNMSKDSLLYGVVPNMLRYRPEKFEEMPIAA